MTAILKIDGTDFYPYLRVAPGEGFDPADPDWLEPQFSDSAVGAGDPLLSIREHNREMVWPLWLNAATKPALHQLVRDTNRQLRNAKQVEWRDEGATNSTFLDTVFARLEAEYSFRHAQQLWLKCTLRVYTQPYGHTGTSRLAATAAGTGVALALPLGALDGDAVAAVRALVQAGSQVALTARAVGAALVPSGYIVEIPAASLIRHADATLMAASGAAGSQAVGFKQDTLAIFSGAGYRTAPARIALAPASVYEGRNRLFAVANVENEVGVDLQTFDQAGSPLGPRARATVTNGEGWGLVDLGILDVDTSGGLATAVAEIRSEGLGLAFTDATDRFGGQTALPASPWAYGRIAQVIVLPETDLALALDTRRRQAGLAYFPAISAFGTASSALTGRIDALGNPWEDVSGRKPLWIDNGHNAFPYSASSNDYDTWASKLGHPTLADLTIEAAYRQFATGTEIASQAVGVAKDNEVLPVVARYQATPAGWLELRVGDLLHTGGTLLASAALTATIARAGGYLELSTRGPGITARLLDNARRTIATLGASHADAGQPGQAVLLNSASGFSGVGADVRGFYAIRVAEVPSMSLGGRDRLEFDAVNRAVPKTSPSSVYLERADSTLRGDHLAADPVKHAQLVALSLPLDGGVTTDLLNAEVRVREAFTYARA